MGGDLDIHSCRGRAYSFLLCLLLRLDTLIIRCTFIQKKGEKRKRKKRKKKRCSYVFVYIFFPYQVLISTFESYLLGIFIIVDICDIFTRVFIP